jgi:protein gp37
LAGPSDIEWTEATWNPVSGCAIISPGCTNCYAMRMARRLEFMGHEKYTGLTRVSGGKPKWNGKLKLDYASLNTPKTWRSGKTIFVNSMSDLFHEDVPLEYISAVFNVMIDTPQHTYQILTKRSDRLATLAPHINWPKNVWMGVSVENEEFLYRMDDLRKVPSFVKFLSLEPLLGPLPAMDLSGIDWVIAGGESGPNARPMQPDWVRDIRDQCERAGIAFHFKQWGGKNKKRAGRTLDNRTWDELPNRYVVTSCIAAE